MVFYSSLLIAFQATSVWNLIMYLSTFGLTHWVLNKIIVIKLLSLMMCSGCLKLHISYAITKQNSDLDEIVFFAVVVTLIAKDNWWYSWMHHKPNSSPL